MTDKELQPFYRLYSKEKRLTVEEEEEILGILIASHVDEKKAAKRHDLLWLYKPVVAVILLLILLPFGFMLLKENGDNESPSVARRNPVSWFNASAREKSNSVVSARR